MADAALELGARFSYGDYRTWPDEERWELIDGQAWSMSPAPATNHQELSGRLYIRLAAYLKAKPCRTFATPFDVLLPAGDEVDTVVQPGLVVEILSPSTARKDLNEKFRLYERRGVREYWVVDPGNESVQVWRKKPEGGYDSGELREPLHDFSAVSSRVLEGFAVDPKELFAGL